MAKEEKIVVLVKEPGKPAQVKTIQNSLKSFQEIVGGYIECIQFPTLEEEGVDIFLNEEGKLIGLEPNIYLREYGDVLVGTFFVVEGANGECESLKEHQIEKAKKYIEANCL
jgi:hypothetical protein